MAFLAVDKDGSEWIFERKPFRSKYEDECWESPRCRVELPSGSIAKLTDRDISWEQEPIEITSTVSTKYNIHKFSLIRLLFHVIVIVISSGIIGIIGYNKGCVDTYNNEDVRMDRAKYIEAIENCNQARDLYNAKLDSLIEKYENKHIINIEQ